MLVVRLSWVLLCMSAITRAIGLTKRLQRLILCGALGAPKRSSTGSADICLSDGLCGNGDFVWRESCTDITWLATGCKKFFVNGTGYDSEPTHYDGKSS